MPGVGVCKVRSEGRVKTSPADGGLMVVAEEMAIDGTVESSSGLRLRIVAISLW